MKRLLLPVAAVLAAMISCSKEQVVENVQQDEGSLTVSVIQDDASKVFLTAPGTLKWVSLDKLIGFNDKGAKFVSEERGGTGVSLDAMFSFKEWSGEPAYFLFNNQSSSEVCPDAAFRNGKVTATVSSLQKPTDSGVSICRWAPVTVGFAQKKETEEGTSYTARLNHVTGYLKLTFAFCDNIKSLEISTVEKVSIAGKIDITASSIDEGKPSYEVVSGEKAITLMPTGSAKHDVDGAACFNLATFYVAVLPGTFTPVLTFTDNQDRTCTRTATKPVTVNRAEYYNMKEIDANLEFAPIPPLPDELIFNLGKTWNFEEDAPVKGQYGNQKAGNASNNYYGETYTYNYTDASTGYQGKYPFVFCKHYKTEDDTHGYYYDSSSGMVFILSGACMSLPAIPNYCLSKVEMTCNKNSKLQDVFGYTSSADNILHTFPGGASTDTYELTESVFGKQYYLYFYTSSNITVSDLKLKYVKADMPETIQLGFDYALDGNPYANVFTGIPGVSANASDAAFSQESYIFTPNSGSKWYWNGNNYGLMTNGAAPMWLKLPKITGYKLVKVKMGSRQTNSKNVAIAYAVSEVTSADNLTEVASATISSSFSELTIGDTYNDSKDYYYLVKSTSTGLCSFLLTYKCL